MENFIHHHKWNIYLTLDDYGISLLVPESSESLLGTPPIPFHPVQHNARRPQNAYLTANYLIVIPIHFVPNIFFCFFFVLLQLSVVGYFMCKYIYPRLEIRDEWQIIRSIMGVNVMKCCKQSSERRIQGWRLMALRRDFFVITSPPPSASQTPFQSLLREERMLIQRQINDL